MTDDIFFGGTKYTSANEASSTSGLTRDYIARLCREKKVRGRRVGKNWYVSDASFKNFLVQRAYSATERGIALATERRLEYHGDEPARTAPEKSTQRIDTLKSSRPAIVHASAPSTVGAIVSSDVHAQLASALSSKGRSTVEQLAQAPSGVGHAALLAAHVPTYTVTSAMDFLHKLVALTLAFVLTFGTFSLLEPEYAHYAADATRAEVSALATSFSDLRAVDMPALAAQTHSAFTAAAADSLSAFGSVFSTLGNMARAWYARAETFASGLSFPRDLFGPLGGNSLAVQIVPQPAGERSQDAVVALSGPSSTPAPSTTRPTVIDPPHVQDAPAPTPPARTTPVNTIPTYSPIIAYVTQQELAAMGSSLEAKFRSEIAALPGTSFTSGPTPLMAVAPFAPSQRIDAIQNTSISNATVHGVSGLTDGDIPDTITASNYLALSGGTITGDLTVSGTLTPSIISAGTSVAAPYFTATSTTATSTFAGMLAIGTTSPWGSGLLTVGTSTALLYVDNISGKIGIATSSPGATFSVGGNVLGSGTLALTGTTGTTTIASGQGFTIGSSQFVLQQGSGNVGIGTTTPTHALSVVGDGVIEVAGVGNPQLYLHNFVAGSVGWRLYESNGGGGGVPPVGSFAIRRNSDSADRFVIAPSGLIGIGTSTPFWALTVASSTGPQLALVDTTASSNAWTMRSISNSFYLATSSPTATSTTAALSFNGTTGAATFGSPATTTFTGGIQGTYLNLTGTAGASTFPYASTTALTVSGTAFFPGSGIWNSSGNVGIGTNAPDALLSVKTAGQNAVINLYGVSSDTDYGVIQVSSSGSLSNASNRVLLLQPNAGVVATGFQLGIGTTTNANDLTIQNNQSQSLLNIKNISAAVDYSSIQATSLGGSVAYGAARNLVLQGSGGNVGIGTTTPQWALTAANATKPQLSLVDTSLSSDAWTLRSISNTLYIATSTATATSTAAALAINPNGAATFGNNLTVGGTLAVNGLCVEENTLLKIRRRRKNRRGEDIEDDEDDDEYEYDHLYVPIKDVRPGDEVLSLDQDTNTFVYRRIKHLLDTGVQKAFRITTTTGRSIETTANHPYLIRSGGAHPNSRSVAFIDYANIKAWCRDQAYDGIDLKVLYAALAKAGTSQARFYYGTDQRNERMGSFFRKVASFGYFVTTKPVQYFHVLFADLLQRPVNRRWLDSFAPDIREHIMHESARLDAQGVRLMQPKANFDVEIAVDALRCADTFETCILFSGDGDFSALVGQLQSQGKRVVVVAGKKFLSSDLAAVANLHVHLEQLGRAVEGLLIGGHKKPYPAFRRGRGESDSSVADLLGLSSGSNSAVHKSLMSRIFASPVTYRWTRVSELAIGQEIAVAHSTPYLADDGKTAGVDRGLRFERIEKIEEVGEKQMYDIEVEGTHNFVAGHLMNRETGALLSLDEEQALLAEYKNNIGELEYDAGWTQGLPKIAFGGIVAHNTAIFNQASTTMLTNSGATWLTGVGAPSLLALDGNSKVIATSTPTAAAFFATSTSVASTFPYASTTALTVSGTAYFPGSGIWNSSGNVGIGTTSPSTQLHLYGTSARINLDTSSGLNSSYLQFSNANVAKAFIGLVNNAGGLNANTVAGDIGFRTEGGNMSFSTDSGNTNQLYLKNGGNVGIGTTSPVSKLSVLGESAFAGGASVGIGYAGTAAPTGGLIIQGNVGIGTTSPSTQLHLYGTSARINLDTSSGLNSSYLQFSNANVAKAFIGLVNNAGGLNANTVAGDIGFRTEGGNMSFSTNSGNTNQLYLKNGGNVGIGTTTPQSALDVFSFINSDAGYRQNQSLILYASSTSFTTFGGIGAGAGIIANATSSNVTSAPSATAFGYQALGNATSSATTDLSNNTAFGYLALKGSATNFKGSLNTAVGASALTVNSSGINNTAVGATTLFVNTTGFNNTAIGRQVLGSNTTGNRNTALGVTAGNSNQTGNDNVLIGVNAGFGVSLNSYSNNTFLGNNSGFGITTGGKNLFLGKDVASTTATGSNNIALGYDIALPVTNGSNQLNIGNLIFGTGINGEGTSLSTGVIGIGTTTPFWALTVASSTGPQLALVDTTGSSDAWTFRSIANTLYIATSTATATSTTPALSFNGTTGAATFGSPATTTFTGGIQGTYLNLTGTAGASTFPYASTTALTVSGTAYFPGSGIWNSSGNVGIGTTTPLATLHLGTAASTLRINSGATGAGIFGYNDGNGNLAYGLTRQTIIDSGDLIITAATGIGFQPSGSSGVSAAGTKMYINSSGNVGIGTTTPAFWLELAGTNVAGTKQGLRLGVLNTTVAENYDMYRFANDGLLYNVSNQSGTGGFLWQTNSGSGVTSRMVITNAGNVGIGTTTPNAQLVVNGAGQTTAAMTAESGNLGGTLVLQDTANAAGNGGALIFGAGNSGGTGPVNFAAIKALVTNGTSKGTGDLAFSTRNAVSDATLTERMRITSAGNVGIGTTSPQWALTASNATKPQLALTDASGSSNAWTFRNIANTLYVATSSYSATSTSAALTINPNGFATFASPLTINGTTGTTTIASGQGFTIGTSQFVVQQGSGNVGIGTAAPSQKLHVVGSALLGASGSLYFNDTGTAIGIPAANTLAFTTSALERMTIDNSGNVGIGTTSPQQKLHIGATTASDIFFRANNSLTPTGVDLGVSSGAAGGYLYVRDNALLQFGTNNSARMTISADGNVGIGTTSPQGKLELGDSTNGNMQMFVTNSNSGTAAQARIITANDYGNNSGQLIMGTLGTGFTTSGGFIQDAGYLTAEAGLSGGLSILTRAAAPIMFYTNGATNERMRIDSSGNVGIGTTSPATTLSVGGSLFVGASTAGGTVGGLGVGVVNTTAGTLQVSGGPSSGNYVATINNTLSGGVGAHGLSINSTGSGSGTNLFDVAQNSTSVFRILGTGNVGIGTTSPATLLDISGTQANGTLATFAQGIRAAITNLSTTNNTFSALDFRTVDTTGVASSTGSIAGVHTSHTASAVSGALAFLTNNAGSAAERMRITATGNIGIGTANPTTGFIQTGGTNTNQVGGLYLVHTQNSSVTGNQYGFLNSPAVTPSGASLTAYFSDFSQPTISGASAPGITSVAGYHSQLVTAASYAGTISNYYGLLASAPAQSGTMPIPNYYGVRVAQTTNGDATTTGTVTNTGILVNSFTASSSAGGTINNYSAQFTVPSGAPNGGTTNNRALYINGNGGSSANGGTANNYAIYNDSTANNFIQGNVGIGTTTPQWALTASNATKPQLSLVDTSLSSDAWTFRNIANTLYIATSTYSATSTTAALTINPNGFLGIGTSTPGSALSVVGDVMLPSLVTGANNRSICWSTTDNRLFAVNAACTTSSLQFKTNVATSTYGLSEVMRLRPVTFNYKPEVDSDQSRKVGFIAEELVPIIPEVGVYDTHGVLFSIDYPKLTSVLASAIQQLDLQVAPLTSATTSPSELVGLASSTAPWMGSFEDASPSLRGLVSDLADTLVHVFKNVVYAWTGIFNKVLAREVHTDQLCVSDSGGETCVTRAQLDAMLAASAASNAASASQGSSGSSSSSSSAGSASGTPATDATAPAVSDVEPPVITINGNNPATLNVGDTYSDLGASVTDNIDQNLGIHATVDEGPSITLDQITIDTAAAGQHTIVYSATDSAGNVGTATRAVIVENPNANGINGENGNNGEDGGNGTSDSTGSTNSPQATSTPSETPSTP